MNRRHKRRNSYTVDRGNNASPRGGSRACLCKDEKTYSIECCDGSLWAQGIGNITRAATPENSLLQENGSYILQENNSKINL